MTEAGDTNVHFHQELSSLEGKVLSMVDRAERMAGMAVESVTSGDVELADRVIELDTGLDTTHFEVLSEWTTLMARFQPLGSDLRKMAILLQLNTTFERMGDQCVNIARVVKLNVGLPSVDRISAQIREMGDLVRPMVRAALDAYLRQDIDEVKALPLMDEPVDRLNAGIYREIIAVAGDERLLEWAMRMMTVSRALERIGDQAVDFAEHTAYLITGEHTDFGGSALPAADGD